jgi:hypothetical protein
MANPFTGPCVLSRTDGASPQGSYKLDSLLASSDVDLTNVGVNASLPNSPTAFTNPATGKLQAYIGRFVMCDVGGTLTFACPDGSIDTQTLLTGVQYQLQIAYVYKTGTAATGIHVMT